ncbi:MAG: hypothetical protein AB7E34_07525 [Acidaminococcaceae bacterium]
MKYISDTAGFGLDFFPVNLHNHLVDLAKNVNTLEDHYIINIESRYGDKGRAEHPLIDLVSLLLLWKSFKPIVCIGFEPLADILRRRPEDIVLCAPGVVYHQITDNNLPFLDLIQERKQLNPGLINPFIKPRVDRVLQTARHSYANFTAMLLFKSIQEKLGFEISNTDEINNFEQSPEALLLKKYFGFDSIKINDDEKSEFLLEYSNSKRILLIDDQAHEGWTQIISNMVYGNPNEGKLMVEDFSGIDVNETTINEKLESKILKDKPQLILLDLRLKNESADVSLVDLSGFRVLLWLKMHEKFKGLPVIMFTAITHSETAKTLLASGVELVWTKPGLDEQLDSEGIKQRYKQLVNSIKREFDWGKYVELEQFNDKKGEIFNSFHLQQLLLQKLEQIKYWYEINKSKIDHVIQNSIFNNHNVKFNDFTYIYFDTNALITNKDFVGMMCGLYLLSISTSNSIQFFYRKKKKESKAGFEIEQPKVVIMNLVYDELIKMTKVYDGKEDNKLPLKLAISQNVIKSLFDEGAIRTEYYDEPKTILSYPKENTYADPFILDELATLMVSKKMKYKKNYYYEYPDPCKVIVVTNDFELRTKISAIFFRGGNEILCITPDIFTDTSKLWFS